MIDGCGCGSHRLHRVFQFYWNHPGSLQRVAAQSLGMTVGNLKEALWALRRRDLSRRCPECFTPSLVAGVCNKCGYEPYEPALPDDLLAESHHPTSLLHPGNMLGSQTEYEAVAKSLGFSNQGFVLRRKIERAIEIPLLDAIRSDVANALDGGSSPEVSEQAGLLCVKEWREFNARYPKMSTSKLARKQLAENVLARLKLVHPGLKVSWLGLRPPGRKVRGLGEWPKRRRCSSVGLNWRRSGRESTTSYSA